MKALFFLLLAVDAALGAWLVLGDPPDILREPERRGLQIEPERFHLLSDAQVAQMRRQAAPAAAAQSVAPAPATTHAEAPTTDPLPGALPSPACVEIGDFASEAAARKLRARLADIVDEQRISTSTVDRTTRLRVTGVSAAMEARIQRVLKDFPRERLAHCAEAARAR